MTSRPSKPSRGFTLVELLVGVSLALMVMTAVLSTYTYLARNLVRLANQQTLETEARRALAYFAQDVRLATGITDTANISATRVALLVPSSSTINVVTYYYNNGAATTVTLNGSNVSLAANSLTRCVYDGSSVTWLTLLNNITSSGLSLSYYDSAGTAYANYTDYLPGVKQLALQFSTRLGTNTNGTRAPQTADYQATSSRTTLRNHPLLQ